MTNFAKLDEKEMEMLSELLMRANCHGQLTVGAYVGEGNFDSFATDDVKGTDDYNGETTGVTLSYKGLKWLWARVQGARGGKKRKLTSEAARKMAMKRWAKK